MKLIEIYRCLCDETRLRLLNLLHRGPLCVCHFQEVLQLPQVAVSKHLAYLRRHGLVTAERDGAWMIYRLAEPRPPELERQLACLQDCAREIPAFQDDVRRLESRVGACCPASDSAPLLQRNRRTAP
jgi:ArsR family transcriptional regulator, arsenate/arsenite/antimonite-responsive transcriptional repressor